MTKFLVRRLLFAVVVVFFGTFIVYAVMRLIPVSYVEATARTLSMQPGAKPYEVWLKQLNAIYGLDRNIIGGYFHWFGKAVTGEFGDSWRFTIPVVQKFKDVIWFTIAINIITLMVALFISIPLGITAAVKQYSKTDYTVTVLALLGISLPSFFFASLLRYFFAVHLQWFDTYGIVGRFHMQLSDFGKLLDFAHHMVLPVITLSFMSIGGLMRYTRTNMLEVLNADYIRTARAKGLPEKQVINKHAFRNTMVPLVSWFSYLLPSMFGGSMVIESIFAIPGTGYTAYLSITSGDIPFIMFYMAFMLIFTQISLLIADMMYAVVDPRVRIN